MGSTNRTSYCKSLLLVIMAHTLGVPLLAIVPAPGTFHRMGPVVVPGRGRCSGLGGVPAPGILGRTVPVLVPGQGKWWGRLLSLPPRGTHGGSHSRHQVVQSVSLQYECTPWQSVAVRGSLKPAIPS
jgi:hypothetical protein